jgi:hypothetical protein
MAIIAFHNDAIVTVEIPASAELVVADTEPGVQGDRVEMPYEEAVSLVEKYSEKNPINGVKNDTAVWGPILWKVLHDRAAEYAMAIDAETRWLKIFQSWIPCGECKSHFRRLVSEMPPDLSSRKNYAHWAVDVHNKVNESLGKPIFSV